MGKYKIKLTFSWFHLSLSIFVSFLSLLHDEIFSFFCEFFRIFLLFFYRHSHSTKFQSGAPCCPPLWRLFCGFMNEFILSLSEFFLLLAQLQFFYLFDKNCSKTKSERKFHSNFSSNVSGADTIDRAEMQTITENVEETPVRKQKTRNLIFYFLCSANKRERGKCFAVVGVGRTEDTTEEPELVENSRREAGDEKKQTPLKVYKYMSDFSVKWIVDQKLRLWNTQRDIHECARRDEGTILFSSFSVCDSRRYANFL